jgi:hypothetical protein
LRRRWCIDFFFLSLHSSVEHHENDQPSAHLTSAALQHQAKRYDKLPSSTN